MKRNKIIEQIGDCLKDEIYDMGRGFKISYSSKYGFKTVDLRATIDLVIGSTNYLIYAIVEIAPSGAIFATVRITGKKNWWTSEWKRYDSVEHAIERYLEKEIQGKDLMNTLCWQMMDYDFFVELMKDCYGIDIKS